MQLADAILIWFNPDVHEYFEFIINGLQAPSLHSLPLGVLAGLRVKRNSSRVRKAREDPGPSRYLGDAPFVMKGVEWVEWVINESWLCFLSNFRPLACTSSVPHRSHRIIF